MLSLFVALLLLYYCCVGARSLTLSSMIRGKMFGDQRGLLFRAEARRFLILAAVAYLLTVLWTAAVTWIRILLF